MEIEEPTAAMATGTEAAEGAGGGGRGAMDSEREAATALFISWSSRSYAAEAAAGAISPETSPRWAGWAFLLHRDLQQLLPGDVHRKVAGRMIL